MKIFRWLAFSALLMTSVSGANAQDYDKGFAAYDAGDYQTAFKEFLPLAEELADLHGFALRPNRSGDLAAGVEIALVSADPDADYARALAYGASALSPPKDMPWGQRVSYVRDMNGCIVEICSEIKV